MKIRIKGNSIRMRITKSELDDFTKSGYLEEITDFGSVQFKYALQSRRGIENLDTSFDDNKITIFVPDIMQGKWADNDVIGFDHSISTEDGKSLFLLIEKDFACIDNVLEDQSDNFVNPSAVC